MSGSSLPTGNAKRSRGSDALRAEKDRVKRRRRFSKCEINTVKGTLSVIPRMSDEKTAIQNAVSVIEDALVHDYDQQRKFPLKEWNLSSPLAGQYSNLDPIITSNEEHLLLGTETAVHVYSVATSRRARTLQSKLAQKVIGYKLCPENPDHLYIITSTGNVSKWDWLSGDQMSSWDLVGEISHAELCLYESFETNHTLLFSSRERKDGKREISITPIGCEEPRDIVILETSRQIDDFRILGPGRSIIAWAGQHILLGTRKSETPDLASLQYTWREMVLPVRLTCIDIRASEAQNRTRIDGSQNHNLPKMDLVLGGSDGSILVYHDIHSFIPSTRNDLDSGKGLTPRRLHWHRGPVNVVRWSKDGNYLISGGNESVMVLWQLDTGRKQFLPHLSSPICNLVISSSGKSYIVKLSDNCIILLSATELQPYATITGLQLCPKAVASVVTCPSRPFVSFEPPAAVLHPQHPDRLVVAVPASRQATQECHLLANSSVLQTYDIRTSSQVSRQALARTNATTLRISPEGSEIIAPDVRHLDICQDGTWMATIDDWVPNREDAKALQSSDISTGSHTDHRETFLKFWRWNESSSTWELVTRIDGPHSLNGVSVPILGLASRPYNHEFATMGSDAVLRFWCPANRHRTGLETKNSELQLQTWKCRGRINLKGQIPGCEFGSADVACMGFSQDGSVLVICLQTKSGPNSGLAVLVDVQNCKLHYRRVGVYSGRPYAVKFLGRNLVTLSMDSIHIWDTVGDMIRTIKSSTLKSTPATENQLLAVSPKSNTFAVTSQCPEHLVGTRKDCNSQFIVRVYDAQTLSLLSQLPLMNCPVSLLSDPFSGDYVIVDVAANVQRLGCSDRTSQSVAQPSDVILPNHGLGSLFQTQFCETRYQSRPQVSTATVGMDSSSSQSNGLPGVFGDVPPFVLPPANILFKSVVQAFSA